MTPAKRPVCAGYLSLRQQFPSEKAAPLRSSCYGEKSSADDGKTYYCLMHKPDQGKAEEFKQALVERLDNRDYNFRGVWFPAYTNFKHRTFNGLVNFDAAAFSGEVDFTRAKFRYDVNFNYAVISASATFDYTRFVRDTFFCGAEFKEKVYFTNTTFGGTTNFRNAIFEKAVYFDSARFESGSFTSFWLSRFNDYARFMENKFGMKTRSEDAADLCFSDVIFEKPELTYFHSLSVEPHWFIDANPEKFNFVQVEFPILTAKNNVPQILAKGKDHLAALDKLENDAPGPVEEPYKLLIITCNHLAANAEANSRLEEASNFRYLAMELYRGKVDLSDDVKNFVQFFKKRYEKLDEFLSDLKDRIIENKKLNPRGSFNPLLWLYWLSSGYGDKSWRALMVLVYIWAIFALFYMTPFWCSFNRWETKITSEIEFNAGNADKNGRPLFAGEALAYSFAVMALQKPEPKPLGPFTYGLVLAETVLGPLQAALLALAIRRKFMR